MHPHDAANNMETDIDIHADDDMQKKRGKQPTDGDMQKTGSKKPLAPPRPNKRSKNQQW